MEIVSDKNLLWQRLSSVGFPAGIPGLARYFTPALFGQLFGTSLTAF
jgi:hypothetical protein